MELIKGQTVFVYDGAEWPEVRAKDIKKLRKKLRLK